MTEVIIMYPGGQRRKALLAGVPRTGEGLQLRNGDDAPELVVVHVLWMEGEGRAPDPQVLVTVRPRDP